MPNAPSYISADINISRPARAHTMRLPSGDVAVRFVSHMASIVSISDTPERLADMLRFALDEVTALLPADTPPPAEPVDEADIDTVTEADWADVLTDRFGGEAA